MSPLGLLQGSLDNLDLTLDEAIAAWILLGEIVMWLNPYSFANLQQQLWECGPLLSLTICGMPYSLNICFVRSITTLLVFWCLGIFLTKETLEKKSVIIGYSSSSTQNRSVPTVCQGLVVPLSELAVALQAQVGVLNRLCMTESIPQCPLLDFSKTLMYVP